ncbi:hypothetical protein [uncultured Cardiobacterium sp.]|uniref:hypothetical protein n=1 Tax=uncultured Cardiobacterium sp. TaxID=417619 RepID=UPI00261869CF|nr:hypothetical protein [uncultured Cardiobacterium sp.]
MEILIGLTILAVIVRVVIFFCAPELDETLSGFNSPEKNSYQPTHKLNLQDNNRKITLSESEYIIGPMVKHDPNYSPYIGKHYED